MILQCRLKDFRRFADFTLDCHPQINCLVGQNGTGKTTLLEALWTLVSTVSFRTHKMHHLIHAEKKEAAIFLGFETSGVTQSLQFSLQGSSKTVLHNSHRIGLSDLIGILLGVVISTEDLALIEGEPAKRRYFLDLMLSQTDPLYLWHLRRYVKGLKAKNHLLKARNIKPIPSFEEEMGKSGAYIAAKRHHLAQALSLHTLPYLDYLSFKENTLQFAIPLAHSEELKARWVKERPSELRLGTTLSGPHRDDLKIFWQNKEAKHFASLGEKKSLMIALKLAQCRLIERLSGSLPFLLVDDFSSHLDTGRQANFFAILQTLGQVFLTNPEPLSYFSSAHVIELPQHCTMSRLH